MARTIDRRLRTVSTSVSFADRFKQTHLQIRILFVGYAWRANLHNLAAVAVSCPTAAVYPRANRVPRPFIAWARRHKSRRAT